MITFNGDLHEWKFRLYRYLIHQFNEIELN